MAYLASTFTFGTGGRANFSGQLNWISPGFDLLKRIHLPPHASVMERHPSVFSYGGRQYLLGAHTRNIMVDEDLRCLRMGMQPPPFAPGLAAGAGAVPMIGYLRLFDEITGERSSLSDGTEVTGDVPRTWSNLLVGDYSEEVKLEGTVTVAAGIVTGVDTTFGELRPGDRIADATVLTRWAQVRSVTSDTSMVIDDSVMAIGAGGALVVKPIYRASHVEGWLAVNGTLPRAVWQARLGTTSIVESLGSLALGEPLIESYEPMPTAAFGVFYNDRSIVAGVPGHLDTVYLSEIGFPERHGGLRFRTDYGEPVVGLFLHANHVVVLAVTPDNECSYRLAGYTDTDYEMKGLEAKSGGIGHHGNMELPGGVVLVPSSQGMQLFNGAFHPGIPTRQTEWMRDCRDNPAAFEGGFGAVNKNDGTYRFVPFVERVAMSSNEPLPLSSGIYQVNNSPASGNWFSWAVDDEAATRVQLPTDGLATFARPFSVLGKLLIGTRMSTVPSVSTDLYKWDQSSGLELAYTFPVFPNSIWTGDGIYAGCEFAGNFYLAVHYSEDLIPLPRPTHMLIYRWDGVNDPVLEVDQVFNWTTGGGIGAFNDVGSFNSWALFSDGLDIYAISRPMVTYATPANIVKKRNGGSWDTLTLPAGYNYFGFSRHGFEEVAYGGMVRYNGATYIAGHDQNVQGVTAGIQKLKILRVDGADLTEVWARNVTSMSGMLNLFVADGIMYYNYSDYDGPAVALTGSFDGATWNDNVKDWAAAPQSRAVIPYNVVEYDGEFWCSLGESIGPSPILRHTVGRDVAGFWEASSGDSDYGNFLAGLG